MLSKEEVLAQSNAALNQWKDIWDSHAKRNGKIYAERGVSHKDLLYSGVGKTCICVSTAPSLEKTLPVLKKYYNKETMFVACVDKSLGILIDHGIIPDLTIVCDASVDFDKWCKPWIDKTDDILLACCVTANPEWSEAWKGRISFFTNKDNIQSELRYSELSGCKELIPAGSNVGNSVVIFTTQLMGFDEFLLIGYDYCWGDGNYYAFQDPPNKRH